MKKGSILNSMALIALLPFIFINLMQVENVFKNDLLAGQSLWETFFPFFLFQFENSLIFTIILSLLILCYQNKFLKFIFNFGTFVLFFYLVLNQVYYSIFFNHFQLDSFDVTNLDFGSLKDSLLFELDWFFYFNMFLATVFSATAIKLTNRLPNETEINLSLLVKNKFKLIFLSCFVVSQILIWFTKPPKTNIWFHPVVSLAASLENSSVNLSDARTDLSLDLDSLKYGVSSEEDEATQNKVAEYKKMVSSIKNRNVVIVILESVGSEQIFENRKINKELTPNLYSLRKKMLMASKIYNIFPGTTRSHLPFLTGGDTLTWGSIYKEIGPKYLGSNLPQHFKNHGYSSAVFSSAMMKMDNLRGVYDSLNFDKTWYPDNQTDDFLEKYKVNSWGVDERHTLKLGQEWDIENKPFIKLYLTSSAHHPYSTPEDIQPKFGIENRLSRYKSSIHYLDSFIYDVYTHYIENNENTVLVIMGDHGQAFGVKHKNNLTHKNHLYEENIKNFFMVIDPLLGNNIHIKDRYSIGDLFPTITKIAGTKDPNTIGKSILNKSDSGKILYFHKSATPEKWGLIDGDWKFITQKVGNRNPELYNLKIDPEENNNLSLEFPERIKQYHNLTANWYIRTNRSYISNLENYKYIGNKELRVEDLNTVGPKRLAFVVRVEDGNHISKVQFAEADKILAWTENNPYSRNIKLNYTWVSPTGKSYSYYFVHKKNWVRTYAKFPSAAKKEKGKWKVTIQHNGRLIINGIFEIL